MRSALRCLLGLVVWIGGARASAADAPLAPGRPSLLAAAFDAFLDGQQRWAYTETYTSFEPDGRANPSSVIRVDPSQPYAQQYVPLQLNGQAPAEKDVRAFAGRGEQLAKRRQALSEELAAAKRDSDFQLRLLNADVTPVLERATVVAEDATSVTYVIPLRLAGPTDAPPFDAFELTARVSKATRQFEHATFRQRSMIRIAAGKHYDGLIEVEFGTPDPQFPAMPVKVSQRSTNKPLFGPAHTSHSEIVRTELRHVTPYDDRFKVKLAPLKLLDL